VQKKCSSRLSTYMIPAFETPYTSTSANPAVEHVAVTIIEECPICLESVDPLIEHFRVPCCKHAFHTTCIGTWQRKHEPDSAPCPLCRQPIPPTSTTLTRRKLINIAALSVVVLSVIAAVVCVSVAPERTKPFATLWSMTPAFFSIGAVIRYNASGCRV
jgi:hypothetical protein